MIGVANLTCSISELKRASLFFDNIVIIDASKDDDPSSVVSWQSRFNEDSEEDQNFVSEISYLLNTPFFAGRDIVDYPGILRRDPSGDPLFDAIVQEWEEMANRLRVILDRDDVPNHFVNPDNPFPEDVSQHSNELLSAHLDIGLRMEIAYQNLLGNSALQIVDIPTTAIKERQSATHADVLQLTLTKVPVPDDTVPWEQIFEMKQDADLMDRARKLRLWITDVVKPGFTLALAEEKLADGLSDYETYLRHHNAKYKFSAMRGVVVGTAGFLEDVLKLRLEKIVDRFLSVRARRAEMMLAELRAPGRALSLVTLLQDKFKR